MSSRKIGFFELCRHHARGIYKEHKLPFLVCGVFFMVGVIFGVLRGLRAPEVLPHNYVLLLTVGQYSPIGQLLRYSILGIVLLLLIGFNYFKRWLKILSFACIFFLGWRLGLGAHRALAHSLISGILAILLFYIPVFLTKFVVFSVFMCHVNEHGYQSCTQPNAMELAKVFGIAIAFLMTVNLVFITIVPVVIRVIVL